MSAERERDVTVFFVRVSGRLKVAQPFRAGKLSPEEFKPALAGDRFSRPFSRTNGISSNDIPPMNRWAILDRPLRGLFSLLHKLKRHTIHAIAQSRRRRPVVKQMSQVTIALRA